MSLYKRGGVWYFLFYVDGERYRGSTDISVAGPANERKARDVEADKRKEAREGINPTRKRPPTLREMITDFQGWVKTINKAPKTIGDYENGCRLILAASTLAGMRADKITDDDIRTTPFYIGEGEDRRTSPYSTNCALRTLRRAYRRALKKKTLSEIPEIKLLDAPRREALVSQDDESRLLKAIEFSASVRRYKKRPPSPLDDVLVGMLDTGMRDGEVVRMRIEDITFEKFYYFNRKGKTKRARRHVPLSERFIPLLKARCGDRRDGWVFPSRKSKSGHIELRGLQKAFRKVADALGIPRELKLYCSRHTWGTTTMEATGNPFLVMDGLGHARLESTKPYMHNETMQLKAVIDKRNESKAVQ